MTNDHTLRERIMRILIIAEVFLPKVDGVVIRTMNLIRHLLSEGDDVLVVCPRSEGRTNCPVQVVEFASFPFPAYPEYRIGLPDERLVSTIENFAPDVVHYINPFAFGFRCRDLLAKAGIDLPCVFSFHTLYGEFVKRYPLIRLLSRTLWWLMRDYHNTADRNLTVSTIMQQELIERGFERVELWPPAVDCALFDPSRSNAQMRSLLSGGQPERPLLLTVSRLAPEKNVAFLDDVIRQIPEARLAIVGDGPDRAALERRFAGTNTQFFGYLKGEQLATTYASADLFVYASETETMGNVVLEAMASGLASVAPRAGGIPSLVAHERTGLLYDPGDVTDAVACIRRALSQDGMRENLGAAARSTVEQWGWNRSVDCVRQHYLDTIDVWRRRKPVTPRRRRLAPAMAAALVLAFRAMSFATRRDRLRKSTQPAVSPVNLGEPLFYNHGGLHADRPEGAGA